MLHPNASKITNIHQAVICCTRSEVIWRRGEIPNDRTMTMLGRRKYQCQVFSYQMIHNKIAAGRTFLKNRSREILSSPHSIKDNISSLRCFKLKLFTSRWGIYYASINQIKMHWSKTTTLHTLKGHLSPIHYIFWHSFRFDLLQYVQ